MSQMPSKWTFAIIVGLIATVPALTAQAETPADPGLQKCLKAVTSLGASVGHSEIKDPQGRPAFRFTLRTSGMDYMATCDAQSGMVSDIAPRVPSGAAPM